MLNRVILRRSANSELDSRKSDKAEKRICLPYYAGVSEKLSRVVRKYGMTVAYKPRNKLRSTLVKLKDPVPQLQRAGVVYQISCSGCDAIYVGETKRRCITRVKEHNADCRLHRVGKSALVDHAVEKEHSFDFDNARILKFETNYRRRVFGEAWHIGREKGRVCANKTSGKTEVPEAYVQFF